MAGIGRGRLRPALIGGVAAAALMVLGEAPVLRGVRVERDGLRIEVGAVRLTSGLISAALAQAPASVTLTDLVVVAGPATYRVPRAEFTGVTLSRDQLAALLDPNGPEPVAARLARLDAGQITLPELVIEQSLSGGRAVTTYRDVVLRDVVAGRAAALNAASATIRAEGPNAPSGTYGAVAATELDLAGAAALYNERAGAAPAALRRLYGRVTVDDVALKDPNGVEIRLAHGEMRDVQGRPTRDSWGETIRTLSEAKPGAHATAEESRRLMASMADLFDAFEVGSAEFTGLALRDPRTENPVETRLARVSYTGMAAGQPAATRVEGLDLTVPNGSMKLGSLSFTGFSTGSSLRAMAELAGRKPEKLSGPELRRIIPQLGTVRLQNLSFDGVDDRTPASERKPIRFTVRGMELTADRQVNAVPTNLTYNLDGFSLALPPDTDEAGLRTLIDLGYPNLDLSMQVAANWEEGLSELALREVSLRGVNMGAVTVRGTLGNVGRDVFSADSGVATVALLGATARNLNLVIENTGLLDAVIGSEAKRQGKSPDAVRREYGMAASLGIPAVLGNSPGARQVGQAVAKFVAAPKRLTVSLRAKDAAGLGFADFAALGQPSDIMDRLDVTAFAE